MASASRLQKPDEQAERAAENGQQQVVSVTSCRATRPRAAPSALRVASSFNRPLARTSDRFVMFTAAMSTTNSTPPHSNCKRRADVAHHVGGKRHERV